MKIETADAGVSINGVPVLAPQTLTVTSGSVVALAGPSGSGKTTLLHVLGLLTPPSSGHVTVDGVDTSHWGDRPRRRFWRERATFIFQDYGLIDDETAAYNVSLHRLSPWARPGRVRDAGVTAALAGVGLEERAHDAVAGLSGGEKQRVGIARAIYRRADVIFADEPTASLDRDNMESIVGYLRREADRGALVVVATHDESLMGRCDAVHVVA